ncbi:small kinetochore-associated protein [Hyperolius riggenbachi]|uniref:small kinetochore-associated protein n=1 Tax=Hyperolius riggenbachi TaxID=752182 RepID=UPI0035A39DB9
MEKSKLPVFRSHASSSSELIPCAKKPCPPKPVLPQYAKVANITFSSTVPEFAPSKDSGNGKKAVFKKTGPSTRGPFTRHRVETELQDRNQLLEAANSSLQMNLHSAQNTIKEMSEKQEAMDGELNELRDRLEKHMVVLESSNIDPVSGERILADSEEMRNMAEERKNVTDNLLKELQLFIKTTKQQTEVVQTCTTKWKEVEESREQFLEDQQSFQRNLDLMRSSLDRAKEMLGL